MKYKLICIETNETQLTELIGKKLNMLQDDNYTYLLFENNKYVKVETKELKEVKDYYIEIEDSHSLFVLSLC